ncbi:MULTISPECIES: hypothetical protein [Amycolatopsis]|uniref:Uncharacterized protein n=1 Tax=Amycolatopsis albidoflavus TaxID=102226 RepID=A0ABW5I530_9PSEU
MSGRAQKAIERVDPQLWPGSVALALERYRQFLNQPGRWLYVPGPELTWVDPVDARDELERALILLPRGARAELRRLVAPLDGEFERRTLPDPRAGSISPWQAAAWWRRRLQE